jgi:5-oxoprolinase (ATP-hydrolysing)
MRWRFWVDRGGTFTDCIGVDPVTGRWHVRKVRSSDDAPLVAIRDILGLPEGAPIPPVDLRLGTTLATNALLERRGAPTLLVTTEGFGDLEVIGDQTRPDLFALAVRRPPPLCAEVVECSARAAPDGTLVSEPEDGALTAAVAAAAARGVRSVAVALLHGQRAPALERRVGAIARAAGAEHVSLSHEVDGGIGLLGRLRTTCADAYLTPHIARYVAQLRAALPGSELRLMQSSGGLATAERFRGRDAVLSGPAGGVVGLARVARAAGVRAAIGLDMGGTSTDVARYDGEIARTFETEVAGVRIRAPSVAIHTVAAGGGSICRLDGRRATVGPDSAGASPGPLCFGHPEARELTLTDIDLILGRLAPDRFPLPLDLGRARAALEALAASRGIEPLALAAGFLRVADEHVAEAVRRVSVARGHDVREHALVVFGGAAGQHACAIARRLGIRRILAHPLAGVLSAVGIGAAEETWHGTIDAPGLRLHEGPPLSARLSSAFDALEKRGLAELHGVTPEPAPPGHAGAVVRTQQVPGGRGPSRTERGDAVRMRRSVDLRYEGAERTFTVDLDDHDDTELTRLFEELHRREFGHTRPGHPIACVAARVELILSPPPTVAPAPTEGEAAGGPPRGDEFDARLIPRALPPPLRRARVFSAGAMRDDVPVYGREQLLPGDRLSGPALVLEPTSTFCLDPGFVLRVAADGTLDVLDEEAPSAASTRTAVDGALGEARGGAHDDASRPDPVSLEVFANLLTSIAEQMGDVLARTASSVNIRERRDYSCAVFDARGGLVVSAPHIPVHLGAMGESVRAVLAAHPTCAPGDVFATNDPAAGGSHLPDVTVVTPVHDDSGRLRFVVACRGHHADVGGRSPGSMPVDSRTLADEGVVLRALRIARGGVIDRDIVRAAFTAGPFPARRPSENLADIEAQVAANRAGERLLREACARHGIETIEAYMRHLQDDAAACVAEALAALPGARSSYRARFADALDDGTPIVAEVALEEGRLTIDFEGTGAEHDGNLNAPRAVTVAAVLYVLRCLAGRPIPLNDGCLRPVRLRIPPRSLLDPSPDRAVAAGNVETSQRVVDVLLGALGVAAAGQGTMNNLSFGDHSFGYYETIGGGGGATCIGGDTGEGAPGCSGVHVHMTNTRITDPEVLEDRFPVQVLRFGLRRGSGGRGRWPGGDGLVRELKLLRPLRVSLLAERRTRAPFGLAGGESGAPGRDTLDGAPLPGRFTLDAPAGAVLRIETPGGGGYGAPPAAD